MTADGFGPMLRLRRLAEGRFEASNLPGSRAVVFGGQILAQAIAAQAETVPDMEVKSLHTVFSKPATPDVALQIDTDVVSSGRTFTTATVSVRQGTRLCSESLALSQRADEEVFHFEDPPPDVAPPEDCPLWPQSNQNWEIRMVDGVDLLDPEALGPPELHVWSRFAEVPSLPWASNALLAYATDGFLIGTAMRPHSGVGQSQAHLTIDTTVIAHTLAFHDGFDAADWLLLSHRSPYAGRGRSFGRGDVYTRSGRLVASFSQENLIRPWRTASVRS
jgi:acyl-CoA thioesterase II